MALHRELGNYEIETLVTMFAEDGQRSRSHGLRPEVVEAQAASLGMNLITGRATWETYEAEFKRLLAELSPLGITHVIFGDIYLEAAREWAGRLCDEAGLTWSEPLWDMPTKDLFTEFITLGAKAKIVSCNAEKLDRSWLGRPLHPDMLPEFERLGIDPCGENGEFHTVVTRAPAYRNPIHLTQGEIVQRGGYWAIDLLLED